MVVLCWHKYTGPYNPVHKQLDEKGNAISGHKPYNGVDNISLHHDICYRDHASNKAECNKTMMEELKVLKPKMDHVLEMYITYNITIA